jgi:hypothetical protein
MAQIAEKIIEIKTKLEGEKSVKNLKEQIAELTTLMDKLDKESLEYQDTVNLLVDAQEQLNNIMKVGKSQLSAQEGSYNALVNRMAALKKAHKAVTDETTRNRLSEEINSINNQLKEMDANNGVYVRNVGNYENAIKEALKTPQQELKALRLQLAQLTEGTDEYNAVFTRMAQLTHDVTEQQEQLKWSSADLGDILGNISGVATSLAGGFSAFNALTGLIGGESEELEKAMLQTQRFIQLIQGLEQFEQLADKVKGLWKGIQDFASSVNDANGALEDMNDGAETIQEALEDISQANDRSADTTNRATSATLANTAANASNTNSINGDTNATATNTTATATNTSATVANTAATNAQSAANVVATTTTGLFTTALNVLKATLISTGIGALVVALGYLVSILGKSIGSLWNWVSGATKAKETTDALKESMESLNNVLEIDERFWKRREMLLKAQGATDEELYQEEKKVIEQSLLRVQALLKENEAIAANIGASKLQSDKYKEFRESLEKLREKERDLKIALEDFNWEHYCDNVEKARKANEERAKAQKESAEKAAEAHKKEKESAEELFNDLVKYYKDEKTKLKEKYEEEKKLLEKFGKDTKLLTQKYEEEKSKIVLNEEETRKKLREQFQRNLDTSFRYPSLEYFDNQLSNATEKLDDFQRVADTIKIDERGFKTAENWNDNIKELTDTYGVSIQSFEDFENVFEKVKNDFDDAQKELEDYEYQSATDAIDERIEKLNDLTEFEITQKQQEYELYASSESYFGSFTNNYISQMHLRWKTEDDIFQLRKKRMEQEIKMFKEAAEKEGISKSTKLKLLEHESQLEKQLALETAEHIIEQNERKRESTENYVNAVKDSMNGVGDILSNVASAWETSIQAEVDAGEISEEEAEEKMETVKAIQSAQALINTFSSAVGAYQSMASIPIVGPALGAAAAAAAIASGLAQVKAINAVKKGDKGEGAENTKYAEVTPSIPSDYSPQAVTNVTGGEETENLANAMSKTPIWVSVKDIDSAQGKAQIRDKESSF